ncbi:ADAMTS-like protein 5 [Liolophura sinensis]|uniref:ADAMTS-like protein 5 n=1 Tax=Liolophura sinensis TaxID=3198878 RepID=UPI0031587ED7
MSSQAMISGCWYILPTLLLALPVFSQTGRSYRPRDHITVWSAWSWWSDCSRTCGQGVSRRSRDCLLWTGEKYLHTVLTYCKGRSLEYRLCTDKDCSPRDVDFRAYQCSLNNGRHFLLGTSYIWKPIVSADNPCDLTCKAEGYTLKQSFGYARDGTPCSDDHRSVCAGGNCRTVGCDNKLGSGLTFDNCRVCGGNNSSCAHVRKSVLPLKSRQSDFLGYYYIGQIPAESTNIEIRETSRNYVALLDSKGTFLLNGNSVADKFLRAEAAGSELTYSRHLDNQGEVIHITGPTSDPIFLLIKYKGENETVKYTYYTTDLRRGTPGHKNYVPEEPIVRATKSAPIKNQLRSFAGINGHALSDSNTVKSFQDAGSKIEKKRKVKTDKQKRKEAREAKLLQKLKAKEERKKAKEKPAFCKPCHRPHDRNKQFCSSAFVSRVQVTDYYHTKNETRYDVRIIKSYKNDIPLLSREYVWVPYKCRCPKLKIGKEYVIMGRTSIVKERQLRLTIDYKSYVRNYNQKIDNKLEYFRKKKKCQKRKWKNP